MTARFTQTDPIGLNGGINLWGYAAGDPINISDPLGLSGIWGWRTIMGCAYAIAGADAGYSGNMDLQNQCYEAAAEILKGAAELEEEAERAARLAAELARKLGGGATAVFMVNPCLIPQVAPVLCPSSGPGPRSA